ncbi:hypothetical protein BOO23_16625 [Vibrio navarrensis]|nr:hypothetical protein [Vibrio navarrensis]
MKGSIIQLMKLSQPSNSQMASTKSFDISKQLVWRAYQRVKANKGAFDNIDHELLMKAVRHYVKIK